MPTFYELLVAGIKEGQLQSCEENMAGILVCLHCYNKIPQAG